MSNSFSSPKKVRQSHKLTANPETPEAPQKAFCQGKSSDDITDHFDASQW